MERTGIGRETLTACLLLFGFTFSLLGVELILPSATGSSQALLAVALLMIPGFVLRKKPIQVEELGTTIGPLGPLIKNSLVALLVVFPLFALGFHFFQTSFLGAQPQWSTGAMDRWNQEIEHAPPNPCLASEEGPVAWIDRHGLWVLGPSNTPMSVRGAELPESARRVSCSEQGHAKAGTAIPRQGDVIRYGTELRGVLIDIKGRTTLDLDIVLTDDASPSTLRLGRHQEPVDTISASKSPWWLLTYFIIHLGLIALPEEWFFRGYLQGRLDQLWGTPKRFLGVDLGWGLIVSSLAFAALHPILIPGFHRLLVFFPALFFGWLRARTGNIGAAVLVHALSNVLLAVLSRMYGVI